MLSLLRCIVTDGTVCYDGVPTDSLNLEALRSNITIIPQTVSLEPVHVVVNCLDLSI